MANAPDRSASKGTLILDSSLSAEPAPDAERLPQVAPPEPALTPAEMIGRAAALRPLLRDEDAETDARGCYSEEIHQAFLRAGLYRVVQPRRFGGYGFDYVTFVRVIQELARAHPATAWCYTLAASHAFLVASHWPAQAQAEAFGPDGDFRCCQRATPAGTIKRVDGGYEVSGRFGFCSGAPVSTHFIGSAMLDEGEGPPRQLTFLVPRAAFRILPDWGGETSLGMQGSGSNSIALDQVFVPERFVVSGDLILTSNGFNDGTPGTRLHGDPMYLGVAGGAYLTEFGAITTGAARAAVEAYETLIRATPMAGGQTRLHDPEAHRALGKALNLADAAEAITVAAAQAYMDQCARWAADRTPITMADTLRVWGMSQEACQLACRAVDLLFETAGARVALSGNRLQRYFRDVQMYRVHITAQPQWASWRAQAHLGLAAERPGR